MRNSSKNIKFYGTTTAAKANCVSNDGRKSFSTTKNASNSHLFNYFLFIFVASLPGELSTATLPSKEASVELRNDLLCNLGSEHECICNRSLGNLDKSDYVPCHKFIEGKQLEVVSMVMRGINLNSILHTNETYEQYLRRRIARILSQYCDNMPSECPGTLADLHSSSNLVEINNRTTAVIYDEPVFARESVAILRVTFPPGKTRTEIAFVVVKRASTIQLNPTTTLNPTKVKYILSAQIAPLSRVLGGIRIEQFGIEMIAKPREYVDNTKLLIMIGIIGTSIFFCCTIAAIRQICLFRDASKRIKRPSHSAAEEEKKSTRNYGTCTEKFFSNYDLSNGHVKTKSLCSRDSMNSSKKAKRGKKISKCFSEAPPGLVLADRTLAEEPSPRTYQNIFICDHSQLPKEEIDDEFEMEIQRLKRQSLQVRSPRSPFSSDDDAIAGAFQGFQFPERSPTEKSVDKRHSISDNIPSVVLNDENNEANSSFVNGETERQANENKSSETEIDLLCAISEYHPFERPLSRRGSINEEEQEEGEEGTNIDETREETPDPLGDEQQQTTADRDKEKPFILVLKRNRERPIPSESGTDEAEEETEEEDELYQPLKEEGWPSKEQVQNGKRKEDRGGKAEQLSSSEGDATTEKAMLDRHHYERLLESPGTRHDSPKIRNNKPPKIILND